jgi:hypothetical protein
MKFSVKLNWWDHLLMDEKKFILDTNIWISFIITDSLDNLIQSLIKNQIEV